MMNTIGAWNLSIVYGYTETEAHLADRANCPLIIPREMLQTARARVKKDRFRIMTLDTPDFDRLPSAVSKGIWQCIALYTDAPPKGKRDNFGLAALQYLAKMLTNTRNKSSWTRYFESGERLWMALAGNVTQPGLFSWIAKEQGNSAERGMYADFLQEAALILSKAELEEVAEDFRVSQKEWHKLESLILPPENTILGEVANLLRKKQTLFIKQGMAATDEIQAINARLNALQASTAQDFPLSASDVVQLRVQMAEQLLVIHDIERDAILKLQTNYVLRAFMSL